MRSIIAALQSMCREVKLKHHTPLVLVSPKLKHRLHLLAVKKIDGFILEFYPPTERRVLTCGENAVSPKSCEAKASHSVGIGFAEAEASAALACCARILSISAQPLFLQSVLRSD